ncbi:MAG TPA: peptidylprolyl isomerase [Actinomycetales bacterium]
MTAADDVAAWVAGVPVTVADVRRREDALRAGELASRLPVPSSPQGRNVVRWIVQLVATEQVVRAEASARGLAVDGDGPRRVLDVGAALELGGVLATVLSTVPVAGALRRALTADVRVTPDVVRAYYDNNIDEFSRLEARVVDTLPNGTPTSFTVVAGELPPFWQQALFAASAGDVVRLGADRTFTVREIHPARTEPFADVQDALAHRLREHDCDRAFAAWAHQRAREVVVLAHGFEHPGDPSHDDATHRH